MKIADTFEVDEPCEQEAKELVEGHELCFIISFWQVLFDGDMMANVPSHLKKKFGWLAYVFSGFKNADVTV